MDPASAIGLAASIIQLISFTSNLLSKTRKIHNSTDGTAVENLELEAITKSLQELSQEIAAGNRNLTKADKQLKELCDGCQKVTRELLELVQKLKGANSHAGWRSFQQAALTIWKEKEVRTLIDRLERYRRQIDTALLVTLRQSIEKIDPEFTRSASNVSAEILGKSQFDTTNSWKAKFIDELHQNNWKIKNEQDMAMFSACFTESASIHHDQLQQLRILEALRFSDIADRYERIEEAHKKTFEWIFSTPGQDEVQVLSAPLDHEQNPKRHVEFVQWLRSDRNLFWITGKPGAGKSTLMKYLYNDSRTETHLESWKGKTQLVKASFFFWNSGTIMQMSKMGLLRAILHEALNEIPEEVPHHFPDRWRHQKLFGFDTRPWSWLELTKAFEILISTESRKFFFVIDGLDEFEGDSTELAAWIIKASSRPNVKLCVASRPWLVFEDSFKSLPFLRVETLTASDIQLFTTEQLGSSEIFMKLQDLEPDRAQALVLGVLEKSSGVFLWVRLVVLSLLDGLRDGDTVTDLQKRLEELPPDLEKLFQKIFNDLKPKHLRQTSRMIRIILASEKPLTLLLLSFTHHTIEEAISSGIEPLDDERTLFRVESARRRLNSRCKGLLEAPTFNTDGPRATVQFLHRTVRDFVCREDIHSYLCRIEETFDPHQAICASQMLRLKSLSRFQPKEESQSVFKEAFIDAAELSEKLRSTDDALKASVVIELERAGNDIYKHLYSDTERDIFETNEWLLPEWPFLSILYSLGCDLYSGIASYFDWAIHMRLLSYVRHTAPAHVHDGHNTLSRHLHIAVRTAITRSHGLPVSAAIELISALLSIQTDQVQRGLILRGLSLFLRTEFFGSKDIVNKEDLHPDRLLPPEEEWDAFTGLLEFLSQNGAMPPVYTSECSGEEVVRKLKSRWLSLYDGIDSRTKYRLTSLLVRSRGFFRL